jgi:hypothetical protein
MQFGAYCVGWRSFTASTPDYFTNCPPDPMAPPIPASNVGVPNNFIGSQMPASGGHHIGLGTWGDTGIGYEYAAGAMAPLQKGTSYKVAMSVSLADTNNIGVYFYDSGASFINQPPVPLNVKPQVSFWRQGVITNKTIWTRLTSYLIADSAYDNIVIGGFNTIDSLKTINLPSVKYPNNSYYYIDSVVIEKCKADLYTTLLTDTVMCSGRTISLAYQTSDCPFNPANKFTLQLSDKDGSFNQALSLDSVLSASADTLSGAVPVGSKEGMYKLRILSTYPIDTFYLGQPIKVYPQPRPIARNTSPVCVGELFQIAGYDTSLGSKIQWTGPANYSSSRPDTFIASANMAMAGAYIAISRYGICVATDTTYVTVRENPAKGKILTNSPVCEGDELKIYFADANPDIKYTWRGPNSFGSDDEDIIFKNADQSISGLYKVYIRHFNCETEDTISVSTKPVHVPEAYGTSPVKAGQELVLGVYNPQIDVSYQWTGPSGFQSFAESPSLSKVNMSAAGDYIVIATLNGCSASDTISIEILAADDTGYIKLYPNPAHDVITVKGRLIENQRVPMKIVNAAGDLIYELTADTNNKVLEQKIVLPAMAAGNYYLQLKIDGQIKTLPFTIIH